MKTKERDIGIRFGELHPMILPLRESIDTFCSYDFECNLYILEVKARENFYDDWIIEKIKFNKNIQIAKDTNKDFLYLSEYNGIGYVHNVSKLVEKNYDFKWHVKNLPETTEFNKTNWIPKHIGYMHIKDSKIIQLGEGND